MMQTLAVCVLALFAIVATAQQTVTKGTAPSISIEEPRKGGAGGREVSVSGTVSPPGQHHIWIVARRVDYSPMWWPQQPAILDAASGRWRGSAYLGEPQDIGHDFDVAAVVVDSAGHAYLSGYRDKTRRENDFRPIGLPPLTSTPAIVRVRKTTH